MVEIPPNFYLGPVHEVEQSTLFTTIRIPTGRGDELGWVNVWRRGQDRPDVGVLFALPVEEAVVASWRDRGWVNQFIDRGPRLRFRVRGGVGR